MRRQRALQADTTMFMTHVVVNTFTSREHRKTLPTYMRLTPNARHMVTPFAALDRNSAHRTVLDVVVRSPLPEHLILRLVALLARHAVVVLYVTRGAYPNKTRRALKDGVPRCGAIDLGTVWDRAVMELVGSTVHVCPERRFDDGVELGCSKKFSGEAERDTLRAARVVTETGERERFIVDGGYQISGETTSAPLVTTCEKGG